MLQSTHKAEQRIEFFDESEYDETSINNSRIHHNNQILSEEVATILVSLESMLSPLESGVDQSKIQFVMNRTHILISEIETSLAKSQNSAIIPLQQINTLKSSKQVLEQLITDYRKYQTKQLTYPQFFKKYVKEPIIEEQFKKQDTNITIEAEKYIFLKSNPQTNQQKATFKSFRSQNTQKEDINGKQFKFIQEQLLQSKLKEQNLRKQYESKLEEEKIVFQKKLMQILHAKVDKSNQELFKQEFKQIKIIAENYQKENITLKQKIYHLQQQNNLLKQFRKQSIISHSDQKIKKQSSLLLESNKKYQNQESENEVKKLKKSIETLSFENQILQKQIISQRKKHYKYVESQLEKQQSSLNNLKQKLNEKKQENQKLNLEIYTLKIQSFNLKEVNQLLKRQKNLLKHENILQNTLSEKKLDKIDAFFQQEIKFNKKISEVTIQQYDGEGIEGVNYFNSLSSEMKIRFKRCCLKQKDLLWKLNDFEIGMVSSFIEPNQIKLTLFLSCSSTSPVTLTKIKVFNPNQNKLSFTPISQKVLSSSQQLQIPIYFCIHHYPLGPVVLLIDYFLSQQPHDPLELRLLMPLHLFKMFKFITRTDSIEQAQAKLIKIKIDKKICKDFKQMEDYFGVKLNSSNSLKIKASHMHTNTQLLMDLSFEERNLQIVYQHCRGSTEIASYLMKTLEVLFNKTQ